MAEMTVPDPTSTVADVRPVASGPRPVWRHRLLTSLLTVFVMAGATGLLGVHSSSRTAQGAGWSATVEYPAIARAGLDVPWRVEVHRAGGFTRPITIAVTTDYFDIFESQGLDPEPDTQTADGEVLYWTFDAPPGDRFAVDFDANIQPASQWGAAGTVRILDGDDPNAGTVLEVSFSTWLVP